MCFDCFVLHLIFVCVLFFANPSFNCILAGSDLLTSLTSTFDRKWKSLVNSTNLLGSQLQANVKAPNSDKQVGTEEKPPPVESCDVGNSSKEVYRDPSLHKSPVDKNRGNRRKNVSVNCYTLEIKYKH